MKRILHGFQMAYGNATNIWTLTVMECTGRWPDHSTIMSNSDLGLTERGFSGRLGTRRLPAWMDAIPVGQTRFDAVGKWHRAQYRAAYKIIMANLPRIFRQYRVLSAHAGDISVDVYEPRKPHTINIQL